MKKENCKKSLFDGYLGVAILALFALCFTACSDNDENGDVAFDPSKPIVITDFMPKEGGYGSNLILYGDNFGNDTSKLKVMVGGKQANIVSLKNNILYCVVPQAAYDGDIEVAACDNDGEEIAFCKAEEKFAYQKQWLVTTLVGQRFEDWNDARETEGAFDACGYIKGMAWFSFDPKSNFDEMYVTCADQGPIRKINFADKTVKFLSHISTTDDRPTLINWTPDENQDMILTRDLKNKGNINVVLNRASNFETKTDLISTLGTMESGNAAMVHPDGQLYYTCYPTQDIYRYDFETKVTSLCSKHVKTKENLRLVLHPSGKYAYMMRLYYSGNNSGYIARLDYNETTRTFSDPYIVAGSSGSAGYADGVGNKVRMKGPGQGVFVENPEYAGEEDKYDFYFTDDYNHCVRVLTPTGRVYTFAGRGNGSADGGYADGELRKEARFNRPWTIAYDEKRKCFYVGDRENRVIRKIALEE